MRRLLCIGLMLFAGTLQAGSEKMYTFKGVTYNNAESIAAGTSQLRLFVTEKGIDSAGIEKVEFKFLNTGPGASILTEIYFYGSPILTPSYIDDSCPGVDFKGLHDGAKPSHLAGYNAAPLEVFYATEAKNPEPANGVGPDEWVTIGCTLGQGKTYADLIECLESGEIVVGIHVRYNNFSDSFINEVPEPATLVMLAMGGVVLTIRRKA